MVGQPVEHLEDVVLQAVVAALVPDDRGPAERFPVASRRRRGHDVVRLAVDHQDALLLEPGQRLGDRALGHAQALGDPRGVRGALLGDDEHEMDLGREERDPPELEEALPLQEQDLVDHAIQPIHDSGARGRHHT